MGVTVDSSSVRPNYEALREEIRAIVEKVIKPNADIIDRDGIFPNQNLQVLAETGWNSVLIPKRWDGRGLDHVAFAIAAEEIARGCPSTSLVYVMHVGAAQTIALYGNDDQKERWLKPIRQGLIGTYSTSEKATGGHWWFNLSEASRDGEYYILNAEKSFTTSSGQADFYVVQTRSPGAQEPTDVSFFIVDGKLPGIKPGVWEALGVRGNHSGPITYEGVRIHQRDKLGKEGQGREILESGVSPIYLIGLGSTWLGVAEAALEAATSYVKETIHRDFNKRLADYQVIRQQLAEVKVLIDSLKPWQYSLAKQLDELQAQGKPQVELLLPLVEFKIHASEVANKAAKAALDVTGGYGYKRGIFERLFRDARAGIAMGPSNNIAREWIGKALVGLPLELWYEGGD
ncbi:acyl-CoA dehydrogenase family protein [Parageobacillus thermoglucosidasius]|uniref:Acyl-CoA dehydrogenase n=1 Tax=Parageobacillus thermoglucosidasius TaxID=1426 RepID=A0AAN0YPC2_PARTM|nr:acyl-CoA dehydrogenase family protein [Parageobacillus thermoglucosidasius]ALF10252.1 acyl-CoA dehydrogenase [Parageobacillus thermoglucosidasius]ANZ30334.1 acyl-CoA dehydrogenase [Parageobacillus thermoglucosidasius]APM81072.1 acyl-CoA dehydrogenase [Parageobacillus thermoglucosidasius]KJX70786.1 acyl-CoA dehydrogenase [Parageobacillus thermoglucosidasius]RDE21663.1 acyl-CoA dehydrogenase [Parageobacillus thermoglucosidasius]